MTYCTQARGAECIGCGECRREDRRPTCPKCGAELNFDDKVFQDWRGVIVGCQYCVATMEAQEVLKDD